MVYIVISLLLSLFSSGFVLFFLLTLAKDLFKILFQDIGVFLSGLLNKITPRKGLFSGLIKLVVQRCQPAKVCRSIDDF